MSKTNHKAFKDQQQRKFHPLDSRVSSVRLPDVSDADRAQILAAVNKCVETEWRKMKVRYKV